MDLELGHQVGFVRADGFFTERQRPGDLGVGFTFAKTIHDFFLARSQGGKLRLQWRERHGLRQARLHKPPARCYQPQGTRQHLGIIVFGQVAVGASLQRRAGNRDVVVHAEHQNGQLRPGLANLMNQVRPVGRRHADIQQQHVAHRILQTSQGADAINRVRANGKPGLTLDDAPQAVTHHRVVIGDHDVDFTGTAIQARRDWHQTGFWRDFRGVLGVDGHLLIG